MQVFYNTHPQAKTIKKNTEKTIKKPQKKSGAYFFGDLQLLFHAIVSVCVVTLGLFRKVIIAVVL